MVLIMAKIDMNSNPGIVVNVQMLDSDDLLDPNFTWVDISNLSPRPDIDWTYDGANFTSPIAPPNLSQLKYLAALKYKSDMQAFVDARYDLITRMNFMMMAFMANQAGRTNQLAYITPLLNWSNAIILYSSQVTGQIMAAANNGALAAITWDFTTLGASDPHLSLMTAIQISN